MLRTPVSVRWACGLIVAQMAWDLGVDGFIGLSGPVMSANLSQPHMLGLAISLVLTLALWFGMPWSRYLYGAFLLMGYFAWFVVLDRPLIAPDRSILAFDILDDFVTVIVLWLLFRRSNAAFYSVNRLLRRHI